MTGEKNNATPAAALSHVYWIGGGSGAGKSIVSTRLAEAYDMHLYATDDVMAEHQTRSKPSENPYMTAWVSMNMDERWVERSPEVMLDTFHWYRGEAFHLIIEDLLALPRGRLILVEGFRLLPALVEPLLSRRNQAVWLLPTPDFRLKAFTSRGSLMSIAGRTSNPERALDNLLRRDDMFTSIVDRQTAARRLPVVHVNGALTVDETVETVAGLFGLSRGAD